MENVIHIMKPAEGSGNELKPCPFCGGEEIVFMQYEYAAGLRWKVVCCGCMAGIDPGSAQQPHQVADRWNRRQQDTSTTKWIKSPSGEWICEKCRTTCCYEDKDGKTRPDKMGIRHCPRCGRRIINGGK